MKRSGSRPRAEKPGKSENATYKKPDDSKSTYTPFSPGGYCFLWLLYGFHHDGLTYHKFHNERSETSRTEAPRSVVLHVMQGEKVCTGSIILKKELISLFFLTMYNIIKG